MTRIAKGDGLMNRAAQMLAALALLLGAVGQARAPIVYSENWSTLTGSSFFTAQSQIGFGQYSNGVNLPAGWTQSGQVMGWFTAGGPYSGVNGVLLNETVPASIS